MKILSMAMKVIVSLMLMLIISGTLVQGESLTSGSMKIKTSDGRESRVSVSQIKTPTNFEGRLKNTTGFYSLKCSYKDNYFSFNVPTPVVEGINRTQVEKMIEKLLSFYDTVFERYARIFNNKPFGYKFNIVFGKTANGYPYNRIYSISKISNIYANFNPFTESHDPFSGFQNSIMLHEIGHSLFAIIVGNMNHPKFKFIEEGFIEYMVVKDPAKYGQKTGFRLTKARADKMKGLAQVDLDLSVWGKEAVMSAPAPDGYLGVTHHLSGIEFMKTFIGIFGEDKFPEFFMRLKAKDMEITRGDYGTSQIKEVFRKMGYSNEEINKFEKNYHERLKNNVFTLE